MNNYNKIHDLKLREIIINFDIYSKRVIERDLYYSKKKFIHFRDKILTLFKDYIQQFRNETNINKTIKQYRINKRQTLNAFEMTEKNILNTFNQNVGRAFGQAMNAIERDLETQFSSPGVFGIAALSKLFGLQRPKLKEEKDKLEGFTRLRKKDGKSYIYTIQIVPYLILLIGVAQVEIHRQLNETIAAEAGTDLAYISQHPCWLGPQAKEVCNTWRDRIVSITGLTPGFPNLQDALDERPPLFHPNCTHSLHALTPEAEEIAIKKGVKKFSTLVHFLNDKTMKVLNLTRSRR